MPKARLPTTLPQLAGFFGAWTLFLVLGFVVGWIRRRAVPNTTEVAAAAFLGIAFAVTGAAWLAQRGARRAVERATRPPVGRSVRSGAMLHPSGAGLALVAWVVVCAAIAMLKGGRVLFVLPLMLLGAIGLAANFVLLARRYRDLARRGRDTRAAAERLDRLHARGVLAQAGLSSRRRLRSRVLWSFVAAATLATSAGYALVWWSSERVNEYPARMALVFGAISLVSFGAVAALRMRSRP